MILTDVFVQCSVILCRSMPGTEYERFIHDVCSILASVTGGRYFSGQLSIRAKYYGVLQFGGQD